MQMLNVINSSYINSKIDYRTQLQVVLITYPALVLTLIKTKTFYSILFYSTDKRKRFEEW